MKTPDNVLFGIQDGPIIEHYICQTGDELTEVTFDGVEIDPPLEVGSAKVDTPGTYLLCGKNQRTVYCLTPSTTLQDFTYDPEAWEWTEGSLSQLSISTSPDTKIVSLSSHTTRAVILIYQSPRGGIQALCRTSSGSEWQALGGIPVTKPASVVGAIAAVETSDRIIHVFYTHENGSIHELTHESGLWRDIAILPPFPSPPSSLVAIPHDVNYTLQFTLRPPGTVYIYTSSDNKMEDVGTVREDGTVKMKGDAEGNKHGPRPIQLKPYGSRM